MNKTVGLSLVLALSASAWAGPGELFDRAHPDDPEPVSVSDVAKAQPCTVKAGLCLHAGLRTVAVESAALVSATGGKAAPVVPRFARAAAVAQGGGAAPAAPDQNAPWMLSLSANLKRPAWNGNAQFIFFDLDDPESIDTRTYTAMYQAVIKAGPKLAVDLALVPAEGFRAGHTYRLRIAQLVGGKEIVLAEGDMALQ